MLVADSQLPLHLVRGRSATSTFPGQQAASLATVLLQGLSHDRVVRALRLLHSTSKLKSLPSDWYTRPRPGCTAPLKLGHWQISLDKLAKDPERKRIFAPPCCPFSTSCRKVLEAAEQVGEELLSGQARAIWRRALLDGPPEALMTTIGQVRVPDESDPNANVIWGPANTVASAPRPFTLMLGLTSRHWPRQGREDALLPSHILDPASLEPASVTVQDRTHFAVLRDAADEIVYSRSRRDSEGRLLGISPLAPSELASEHLQRSRTPQHAFSESDRLLARRQEFSETEGAKSAISCYRNWRSPKITAHDGLVNSGHPVIEAAIARAHSATSLRRMLTDPLGFVWGYALGWKPPSPLSQEEPLALDNPTYGTLVHELLRETAASLESNGGFAAATTMQVESALAEAARRVALDWELTKPLPPSLLWQRTLTEARDTALSALTWPLPKFKDQKTYVEVPFGGLVGGEDNGPWDRNALVAIPGLDLKLRGKIDRLDLAGKSTQARVIDYKTGKCPDEEPGLKKGEELQRCLYAVAVKALLAKVTAVEAALLYPGPEGSLFLSPTRAYRPRNSYASFKLLSSYFGPGDLFSVLAPKADTTTWLLPFPQTQTACISRKRLRRGTPWWETCAASGERTDAGLERRKTSEACADRLLGDTACGGGRGNGQDVPVSRTGSVAFSFGSTPSQRCSNHLHRAGCKRVAAKDSRICSGPCEWESSRASGDRNARWSHRRTASIPLVCGSRLGRVDLHYDPWILSAADYALPHRGECGPGSGNDGRGGSRSEPQDVAAAVAPQTPGGPAGRRSARRTVSDRRRPGSKAGRATG